MRDIKAELNAIEDYLSSIPDNAHEHNYMRRQARAAIAAIREREVSQEKLLEAYNSNSEYYARENFDLLNAISPFLGLKPFKGSCNNEQIIWAETETDAKSLLAGSDIFTFVRKKLKPTSTSDGSGNG